MSKQNPIVIIDDDADDRANLKEALEQIGAVNELVFFEDGDLAFNYLMSTPKKPFLILSDINLPRTNGIQLKQRIDATDYLRAKAIPFVFLTTADSESQINAAYQKTNMQGYFCKSMNMQTMKQQMRVILDYWNIAMHPTTK